jgi:hypothetical protein
VWHCHLLGHEENDMMRPLVFDVSPLPPTALTAAGSLVSNVSRVTLNWTNNDTWPAATNYHIERATNAAFTSAVTTFNPVGRPTTFVDTSVTGGTHYFYRVRAENAISFSAFSNSASVTAPLPVAPGSGMLPRTNLRVTAANRTTLDIAWTNPTGGVSPTSLQVQISTIGATGPWTTVATLSITRSAYTIALLRRNTPYWIRIVAVNASGTQPSAVLATRTLP